MPTVLMKNGWRLFFYSNERSEPPHIHARKGNMECKYWLNPNEFDIELAYSYAFTAAEHRQIRRIIFDNFDYLVQEYGKLHGSDSTKDS